MSRFATVLSAVIITLTISIASASAQLIAEGAVVTDYIWRGFNVLRGAPAFQPNLTGILGGTGFDLNVWFSWALRNRDQEAIRDLDELDLTLTYQRDIGRIHARAGVFTYHLYTAPAYPDETTFVREAFAGIGFNNLPLTPWVAYNYELLAEGGHDGYLEAGLAHSLNLGSGQPGVLTAHFGWYKAEWASLGGQLTDATLKIVLPLESGRWTVTPWLAGTFAPPDHVNPDHLEVYGGLSLSGVFPAR